MAQPTPGDVHVDAALSNVSIGYMNDNYIADKIFPIVPVDKQSDYYFVFTKNFWFINQVERRGPGSRYAEGGLELSSTQYVCINKGLSFPLAWETINNQDAAVDLETEGAEWLAQQFMLDREITLAAAIFDATAWTNYTTLSGATQWSDYANSDPVGDINTGIETVKKYIGRKPNTVVMGSEVWDKLKFHPDMLDMFKHTQVPKLTPPMFASVFEGIDQVLIGDAVYDTGGEEGTFTGTFIWPKNVLLCWVAKSASMRAPSAGYTFVWKQNGQGGPGAYQIAIRREEERLRNRDMLLADSAYTQKVTAADSGYEIIDAVA